ncbi:MAG: hypothetical protein JXA24_07520 [Proteobacteria bacterium]|nr:hypothetical protein [Pseudomonadota bacterium]
MSLSVPGMSLGAKISLVMNMARTRDPLEAGKSLSIGKEFARQNDFYLPTPDMQNPDWFREYKTFTVPYLVHSTRRIFSREVREISAARDILELFINESLSAPCVVKATSMGLLSYNASSELLLRLEEDLDSKLESLPPVLPSSNPYFGFSWVARRTVLDAAFFLSTYIFLGEIQHQLFATAGFAAAMEAAFLARGLTLRRRRVEANLERAARSDELVAMKNAVVEQRAALESMKDNIPFRVDSPDPANRQMRIARIVEQAGDVTGRAAILDSKGVPRVLSDRVLNYIVVELPGEAGREIRVAIPEVMHPHLFIEGDKLVGAGTMIYRTEGARPELLFDGRSDIYPTTEDSVMRTIHAMLSNNRGTKTVESCFRRFFGADVDIRRVDDLGAA